MEKYTLKKQNFERDKLPSIIQKQYDVLYEMYDAHRYYGVLYKVKDVLELALKIPVIILLAGMENYIKRTDVEACDVKKKKSIEVMDIVLTSALSLGKYEDIASKFARYQYADMTLDEKDKELYQPFLDILKNIAGEYYCSEALKRGRVSAWRNDYLGHGALNVNEEEVLPIVEPLIKILNYVLLKSDYSTIKFKINKSEIIICSSENEDLYIRIDPYINKKDYIFDSYEAKRNHAYVLNYLKGDKKSDNPLAEKFKALKNKTGFERPENDGLESDKVFERNETILMNQLNYKIHKIEPFFEETKKLLAKDKGVLLLRASRGMGKSTFATSIEYSNILSDWAEVGDNNKDLVEANQDVCVWCYHFNEFYKSDKLTFLDSLPGVQNSGYSANRVLGEAYFDFSCKFRFYANELKRKKDIDDKIIKELKGSFSEYLKELLNATRGFRLDCKLLIVFDGIDEIPSDDVGKLKISDLLDESMLPDEVYILMLSRPEDEWVLPDDIRMLGFEEVTIDKQGSYEKSLVAFANSAKETAKEKSIGKTKTNISKIKAEDMVKKADGRMIRLEPMCSIIKFNPDVFNSIFVNNNDKFLKVYLDAFEIVSSLYKNQLQKLLTIIGMTRYGLTLKELYFLFTGNLSGGPTFYLLALMTDLRCFIKSERSSKGNLFSLANEELYREIETEEYAKIRDEILSLFEDNLDCDIDGDVLTQQEIIMTNIYKEYKGLNKEQKLNVLDSLWKMQGEFSGLDETTKAEYKELMKKIAEESELEDNEMFLKAQYLLSAMDDFENYIDISDEDLFSRFRIDPDIIKKYPMEFLKLMQAESYINCSVGKFEIKRNVANIYYILLKEQLVSETYDIFEKIYLPMYKKAIDYDIKDFYFLKDLYFYDKFKQFLSGTDLAKFYIYRAYMFRYFAYKSEISTSDEKVKENFDQGIDDWKQFFDDLDKGVEHLKKESNVDDIYLLVSKVIKYHHDYISIKDNLEDVLGQIRAYLGIYNTIMSYVSQKAYDELVEDYYFMYLNYFDCLMKLDVDEQDYYLISHLEWMKQFYNENNDRIRESKLYCERSILIAEYKMLERANNVRGIHKLLEGKIEELCKEDNYAYKFGMTRFGAFLPSLCAEKIKLDFENGNIKKVSNYLNIIFENLSAISVFPQEIDVLKLYDAYKRIFEIIKHSNLENNFVRNMYMKMVPTMPRLLDCIKKHKDQYSESLVLLYFAKLYVINAQVMEQLREFDKSYNNYSCAKALFDCSVLTDNALYKELVIRLYDYFDKMNMEDEAGSLRKRYNRIVQENSEYDSDYVENYDHFNDSDEWDGPSIPWDYYDSSEFNSTYEEFDSYHSLFYSINVYKIFKNFKNSNVDHFLFSRANDKFGRKSAISIGFFYIDVADWYFDAKEMEKAEKFYSAAVTKFEGKKSVKLKLAYALSKRATFYMANDRKEDAKNDLNRVQIITKEFELDVKEPIDLEKAIFKRKIQKSIENREKNRQKLNELQINDFEIILDDDELE